MFKFKFNKISSHALSMTAILALSACAMQQNPAPVSDATQGAALPNITYDANANAATATQAALDATAPYTQTTPTTPTANPYGETPYAPNTPNTAIVNTTAPTFSAGTQAAIQELVGNVNGVYYGNYSPVDKTASIHIVQRGDTVYNISKRYGISQDTLRSLNNLSADNTISLGQSLRVKATGNSIGNLNNTATPVPQAKPVVSQPVTTVTTPSVPPKTAVQTTPAVVPSTTTQPEVVATPAKSESSKTSFATQNKSGITWQAPTVGKIHYPFGGDNKGVDISGMRGQDIYAAADGEVVYSGTGLRGYGKLIIIKHNETYLTAYGNNDSLLVSEGQTVKRGQQIAKMGSSDSNNGVKLHFELRENGTPVNPNNYIQFN